ncbi:MAG TPA: hypothetical protein VKS22_01965 [Candidatus Binataceae bacterium]|nr:hypothetical protein [Candidatus Binataceae bacterium]
MVDANGGIFSLVYLPRNTVGLPAPVAAIIALTPLTRAALGLPASWDVPLTLPTPDNPDAAASTLVLYAVYSLGQTPAL